MATKMNSLSALRLLSSNSILLHSFYTLISLKEWRTSEKKESEYSNDKIINISCNQVDKPIVKLVFNQLKYSHPFLWE